MQPPITETQQDSEQNTQTDSPEERTVIPEVIGRPYENTFGNNEDAKNAWDMIVYDGKLFLGSGDYGRNSGCRIACYDLVEQNWTLCKIPDEEINEFCIIGGKLAAPGIDPRGDWSLGNYYVYENGEWNTVRTIPGGIHNFSMVEHDGLIFAGLGVLEGQTPVAVSLDDGKTFNQVPFYKDGEPWCVQHSDNDRALNLFVLRDRVYAVIGPDECVYIYEDGCFKYVTEWYNKIGFQSSFWHPRSHFYEAVTYHDTLYLATGYLFAVTDVEYLTFISMEGSFVWDLYVDNDTLYVLTSRQGENGEFICSVYTVNECGHTLLFCFRDEIPATSFAVNGSEFYFFLPYSTFISEQRSGCVLKYRIE
ncbi:MAG: hypothetical protein IJW70_04480 [Clostridia bacterium]|nr:hypothetical protein [Clostridia bacterium]